MIMRAYGPPSPVPVRASRPANPLLPSRYALQMDPSGAKTGYPAYSLTAYVRPVMTGFSGSLNVALKKVGDDAKMSSVTTTQASYGSPSLSK